MNDRIDPLRRVSGGTDRVDAVTRLTRSQRRDYDEDASLPTKLACHVPSGA